MSRQETSCGGGASAGVRKNWISQNNAFKLSYFLSSAGGSSLKGMEVNPLVCL